MLRLGSEVNQTGSKLTVTNIRQMPGHLIRRMQQASVAVFSEKMAKAGIDLTSVQFAALVHINAKPGIDQTTLARAIAYDKVTIGGVVDRLCQKGFVLREPSQIDRRARVLRLTDQGQQMLTTANPIVEKLQADILSKLDADEQERLVVLLTKATGVEG